MKELLASKIESDTLDNKRDRINFDEMTEKEIEECKKEIDELQQNAER